MTAYLILQQHEAGVWTHRGLMEAASAEAAIRKFVDHQPPDQEPLSGKFVAVPERSFQPVGVAVETTHRVKIVGAGNAAPAHPRGAGKDGDE